MYNKPIFFERNRVFRVYKGGKMFAELFGDDSADGNYPEEWVASSVAAFSEGGEPTKEGISRLDDTGEYFDDILREHKAEMLGNRDELGVLVKFLDSAIRLPVQAHPDNEFSRKYFNSEYGKAESWLVLATRPGAKVYMGFKEGVTREKFIEKIEKSEHDKTAMEGILNSFDVQAGDVFFVPPKAVHAIGAGCLILEVQEPTDFTIEPEHWCGDYKLSEKKMFLGLGREMALDCFDFTFGAERAAKECRKTPVTKYQSDGVTFQSIISYDDTPCFAVNRYAVNGGEAKLNEAPAIYIVAEGRGILKSAEYEREIKRGDYFFMPYCLKGQYTVQSSVGVEFTECLPPKNENV